MVLLLSEFTGALAAVGFWVTGWLITSIAVYLAARAVTGGEATLKAALLLTSLGVAIVAVSSALAGSLLGSTIGVVAALVVWLCLIKYSFRAGWLGAFAIAILATVIVAGIGYILSLVVVFSLL